MRQGRKAANTGVSSSQLPLRAAEPQSWGTPGASAECPSGSVVPLVGKVLGSLSISSHQALAEGCSLHVVGSVNSLALGAATWAGREMHS